MLTFTAQNTLYQTLTNNTSSANVVNGNTFIQQFTLELVHKYPFITGERTFTNLQTFPGQQFYNLSSRIRKLGTIVINVGNTGGTTTTGAGFNWPVLEAPSRQFWNNLNLTNNISSDIPQYFFFYNNQLGIYPKPASGYNPVTLTGQVEIGPTSTADYTTGTITTIPYGLTSTAVLVVGVTSLTLTGAFTLPTGTYQLVTSGGNTVLALFTNGSTAVTWMEPLANASTTSLIIRTALGGEIITGSGTSWTTAMTNFVFQVAEPTGDNFWYTVAQVFDSTHLALTAPYEGNAISAGSSTYIIGEASIIPQAYQFIPVYRSCALYYTVIVRDDERKKEYKDLADVLEAQMRDDYGDKNTDPTIQDDFGRALINPNLTINTTQSTGNS